jgi:hypothetical protein
MRDFVEAEGLVHLMNPGRAEFTLCGDAFDLATDEPGYEQVPTTKRTVTCPDCAAVIVGCRGVRVLTNNQKYGITG